LPYFGASAVTRFKDALDAGEENSSVDPTFRHEARE